MEPKGPYAIDMNICQHRVDEDMQTMPALLCFLLPGFNYVLRCVYLFGQLSFSKLMDVLMLPNKHDFFQTQRQGDYGAMPPSGVFA